MGRPQLDLLLRIRVVIFRQHLGTCDWNVRRGPRWKYEFGTWQTMYGNSDNLSIYLVARVRHDSATELN